MKGTAWWFRASDVEGRSAYWIAYSETAEKLPSKFEAYTDKYYALPAGPVPVLRRL